MAARRAKSTTAKNRNPKSKYTTTFKQQAVADYQIAFESREISIISRREVLTGKAKFGILGDGKELPQLALAHVFQKGDFRSGYYRDQTLMLATGNVTAEQLFAQLYANTNLAEEPHSGGRQMNAHFATRSLDANGLWNNLMDIKNSSADVSCTAGQMPRAVGLALASKKYREVPALRKYEKFTRQGNEVVFATIGDASTSEGIFWESVNAAGVLKIPLAISVWDDGYGISVPTRYQTTKCSISEALKGFEIDKNGEGFYMYKVEGWDYEALCKAYKEGIAKVRANHRPAIFHICNLTQPQGHSTSGSHERYKSEERLKWEKENDGIFLMREWLIDNKISDESTLKELEKNIKQKVKAAKNKAWKSYNAPIKSTINEFNAICSELSEQVNNKNAIRQAQQKLKNTINPTYKDITATARNLLINIRGEYVRAKEQLIQWKNKLQNQGKKLYTTHLYSESSQSALKVPIIPPQYSRQPKWVNGSQVVNACFNAALARDPRILAFGEDVGKIGDVNQGFAGLQDKYGEQRVFDTGIREATIIGQGIGMAMRGLRPIAEIQYLDYMIYGLQPITDDLATLHYRSCGGQKAPLIIRTRGHRLEGIWHTGSPMSMLLGSVRGVHLLVPRNMTQAAGFYNTLLQADDPAIVIECLNGYRLKEKLPENIGKFTIPLGVPDILRTGTDITMVTYGACCRIVQKAAEKLSEVGIEVEIIDVQSLLPFDIHHSIVQSLAKTNRLLLIDEDVPGGGTAFMLQKILEEQNGYQYLDSPPATLTAQENRTAYGSDGDYYCKPSVEDVFEKAYSMMHEYDPEEYPMFF